MAEAERIDGKAVSAKLRADLRRETEEFTHKTGIVPGLAVVLVGNNPASEVYVRNKKKAALECGFYSEEHDLPADTTKEQLDDLIRGLNRDPKIHGILVQLPLPAGLDERDVILGIDPSKDVDAFHPYNAGKIMIGEPDFLPCTPAGVMELLRAYGVEIAGKECVVVGRSNIVGKPQAMLLLAGDGTVTVCHSKTKNLCEITRRADILVVAVGRADFIRGDMVKDGAVVIDVGMNRRADGKLCGDVCFDEVKQRASLITPVPGGVGPMTITMLMKNTLTAARRAAEKEQNEL